MSDAIEKTTMLPARIERVWRALADAAEFGAWFRVRLDAPFVVGAVSRGHVTYPGYEHLAWEAWIVAMEPPRLFAFRWHPAAIDPQVDYSAEPTTLVEFLLEPAADATRLTVRETGFAALPADRRADALRMNDGGWAEQLRNVAAHVAA